MSSATTSQAPPLVAANPPTFSYAMAAKGHKAASSAASNPQTQPTSGISTPPKDTTSTTNTPPASLNGAMATLEIGEKPSDGDDSHVSNLEPSGTIVESSKAPQPQITESSPVSPNLTPATMSVKEEAIKLPATSNEPAWRKTQTATGNSAGPDSDSHEGRRGKKSKKQKNAEREAEKEAEKEKEEEKKQEILFPAPPPTVNPWSVRSAQQAKSKPVTAVNEAPQALTEVGVSEVSGKTSESKRKGKLVVADEGEKAQVATHAVGSKEAVNANKVQKKVAEPAPKAKDDNIAKRSAPRGSRAPTEKDDKAVVGQLPPPVEDAFSWPTPETALEEEKRKSQEKERAEREEKDEPALNKPRQKEKWVAVPFVPSVQFQTQVPDRVSTRTSTRGGRGRGGRDSAGRGTHASNGGTGDRANTSARGNSPTGELESRGRGNSSATRSNSLPPNAAKRSSTDVRTQGKNAAAPSSEKLKNGQSGKVESAPNGEARLPSSATADQALDNSKATKPDQAKGSSKVSGTAAGVSVDHKGDSTPRSSDQSKDGVHASKDVRNESRAERGRGGFPRGRGGHNGFTNGQSPQSQQPFVNGQGPQSNGYPPRQNSNPYSSPQLQSMPFSNQFGPPSSRGGRNGRTDSRSQSIPGGVMYPLRYPAQSMAPIQTQNPLYGAYQQHPQQSLSAGPYNHSNMIIGLQTFAMVTMQLNYYFSLENLVKDTFLRKHFDDQGYVSLPIIAAFNRMASLTSDYAMIVQACQESQHIELIVGEDGIERIRAAEGWQKWVLPVEVRHPIQSIAPQTARSPGYSSPTGLNGVSATPTINGNGSYSDTPLTADAPSFAPGMPLVNGTSHDEISASIPESETAFPDEQIAELFVVFNPEPQQSRDGSKTETPFHGTLSRTFSNGSIDGRSTEGEINGDSRQGRGAVNGSHPTDSSPEATRRSKSPLSPVSPKSTVSSAPTVMWAKGQEKFRGHQYEPYITVHERALKHRLQSIHGETHDEMKQLYLFWSHFLCRNFNPTMYLEFKRFAAEDADRDAMDGTSALIDYYDETLNSKNRVIADFLAHDYVELVNAEKSQTMGSSRPAFSKLRTSWRNGAVDMKSRKKIDSFINKELKVELDDQR